MLLNPTFKAARNPAPSFLPILKLCLASTPQGAASTLSLPPHSQGARCPLLRTCWVLPWQRPRAGPRSQLSHPCASWSLCLDRLPPSNRYLSSRSSSYIPLQSPIQNELFPPSPCEDLESSSLLYGKLPPNSKFWQVRQELDPCGPLDMTGGPAGARCSHTHVQQVPGEAALQCSFPSEPVSALENPGH